MVQVNKIGDQLQATGDKVASLEGHLWDAAADLDSLLSEKSPKIASHTSGRLVSL